MGDKRWKVYIHINNINNKLYVGITSKSKPEHRWNSGRGYAENTHFSSAIKKYGWDNFRHIILYDDLTEQQAKDMEKYTIAQWRTQDVKYGYNMTSGGDGTSGFYPSKETRKSYQKRALKKIFQKRH